MYFHLVFKLGWDPIVFVVSNTNFLLVNKSAYFPKHGLLY